MDLSELPLAELQALQPAITADVFEALTLRGSMAARKVIGGTAPAQVLAQVARHRLRLG
jgi:argininosuccinate lyase